MCDKVVCLGCASAGVRVSKVIAAADEACIGGAGVVTREIRVDVICAFGGLERASRISPIILLKPRMVGRPPYLDDNKSCT